MRFAPLLPAVLLTLSACELDRVQGTGDGTDTRSAPTPSAVQVAILGPGCIDQPGTYLFRASIQPWSASPEITWYTDGAVSPAGTGASLNLPVSAGTYEIRLGVRVQAGEAGAEAEKVVRVRAGEDALSASGLGGPGCNPN